jgi:hypothetical protein
MNNNKPVDPVVAHYFRQVHENSREMLKLVFQETGLPEFPTNASQLRPVPVFEEKEKLSLLGLVNRRIPTTIYWPDVRDYEYVPAYYKRYRDQNRRPYNKIIVNPGNYCYSRFFAAKELMHCSLDEENYPVTNTFELVNNLVVELAAAPGNIMSCAPQTLVDQSAWMAAALYTMPEGWLPLLSQLHKDMCAANMNDDHSYRYIAELIRVPEVFLRHRLKDYK